MIKGSTKSGFEFEISKDILQDAEFLEPMYAIQDGEASQLYKLINVMLGKEQKKRLWAHIKKVTGKSRVMQPDVETEIADIFNAITEDAEAKNS